MDIGDASDRKAVELGRQAGNDEIMPRDLDGGRLDDEPVAQGGGAERAGGCEEKLAAGQLWHAGKLKGKIGKTGNFPRSGALGLNGRLPSCGASPDDVGLVVVSHGPGVGTP